MSTETLSQTDIDRMLGGSAAATVSDGTTASVRKDVQVYDFRRPHRVSKERLRILEAMYERLAKSLEAWLIGKVRRQVSLRMLSVEQFSFGEFTLSLPTPCAAYGFDIRNANGFKGVIDVGHEFAFLVVERLFGGVGGESPSLNRGLTPIERLAVRIVVERLTTLLEEVWHDHVNLELELSTFESFPDMIQIANQDEPVLVANIEVAVEGQASLIVVCLPFNVLEKFFSSGDRQRVHDVVTTEPERRMARETIEGSLRMTHVDVAVRLPPFQLPMKQLLGLQVGATLTTGLPIDSTLSLLVNGETRYHVMPGRVGQQFAVRILDTSTPVSPPVSHS
ncbi:MAG: flagellar motor switch protein FliM [Gemmatimonadaceae bacterium]